MPPSMNGARDEEALIDKEDVSEGGEYIVVPSNQHVNDVVQLSSSSTKLSNAQKTP